VSIYFGLFVALSLSQFFITDAEFIPASTDKYDELLASTPRAGASPIGVNLSQEVPGVQVLK
jgi:hypothetical protein